VADEVKSYEKSDREVHFDRQTGKMLGWFIEHRPSRVTRLFGTIIGRAETELDVPREMTTRSLRSSIRMDGGFGEKTDRLDEFLDLVSPPRGLFRTWEDYFRTRRVAIGDGPLSGRIGFAYSTYRKRTVERVLYHRVLSP